MINTYDIAYGLGLGVSSPVWLLSRRSRNKVLAAFRQRMGRDHARDASKPAVWIHAVSLGEMNATRAMIRVLQRKREDLQYIVSTTTTTGFNRGKELYGEEKSVTLIRYPLDFSWAVGRSLDALKPSAVVLMELEVWPNFLKACERRKIPVMLANGRITAKSYRNYKLGRPITRGMFRRLAKICAQDQVYADRFINLGAPAEKVKVTGTMKFDTAAPGTKVTGTAELAAAMNLTPGQDLIWVAGSTGPGEEKQILTVYRDLLRRYARLRLVIVPRHPERFDEVATLIRDSKFLCVRRSAPPGLVFYTPIPPVVLGDTMGELRKFYAMADYVFVGRSLVDLGPSQHGSDMIEPAALAKPVVVGPYTHNFADAMKKFRDADAICVVDTAKELDETMTALIAAPERARAMGERALAVVRQEQGATMKHIQALVSLLDRR
ncbi:lipid IV(A) 3-deoxy-D-manno-octulosonic acid transferase [soil metagenome]